MSNLMVEQGYEIQIFYNGLQPEMKFMVNVSAGGSLKDKTYEEVRDLFKKIAENGCHSGSERAAYSKKNQGLLEVNATQRLEGQMAQVLKVLGEIQAERQSCKVTKVSCGLCQNSHHNDQRPQGAWNDQGSCNNQGNHNWNKPPTSSGSQQNSDLQGGFGEQGNKGNDDNSILTRMNEMKKMMNDLMVSQLQERDLRMQEIRRVEKMMEQCHAIQLRGGKVVPNQEERKEVQSSTDETKENQMVQLLCAKIQKLEDVIKNQETQLMNISEKLVRARKSRRKKAKKGSVEQNASEVGVNHIEIPGSENGLNAAKTKRRRRRRSKKVIKSQDTNKEQTLQLEQNSSNEELQGTTAQTEICEQFEGSGEEFRDEYSGLNNDAKVGIQDPNLENGLLQLLNLPPQFISVLMDEKNPVIKFGGVELRLHKGLTLEVSASNKT